MQKRLSNGFISDMDRLQPHLAVVLLLVLSAGCGQNQREVVTERYSTGEKKKVLTYEGQGAEEELIKRQTMPGAVNSSESKTWRRKTLCTTAI